MDKPLRIIVLIGMPGSGKSTAGKRLARRLGWEFFDTDADVERAAGMTIPEIFAQKGEPAFRAMEKEALGRALGQDRRVVSTGGGAVMDPANVEAIRSSRAFVAFLRADPVILAQRNSFSKGSRPLLNVEDPLGRLRSLLAQREPVYLGAADYVLVERKGLTPDRSAREIVAAYARAGGRTD